MKNIFRWITRSYFRMMKCIGKSGLPCLGCCSRDPTWKKILLEYFMIENKWELTGARTFWSRPPADHSVIAYKDTSGLASLFRSKVYFYKQFMVQRFLSGWHCFITDTVFLYRSLSCWSVFGVGGAGSQTHMHQKTLWLLKLHCKGVHNQLQTWVQENALAWH